MVGNNSMESFCDYLCGQGYFQIRFLGVERGAG